jgi:signal transduction histidine kinase/DNA-binding response OmpR family regulator/ligand-binding sensor domain-containing protein
MWPRFVISLLLLFCFLLRLSAQLPLPEILTIEQGLSQGMVYDVLQTRDGFLWAATKDGVNRFDGYNFKIYNNNPFDPYSLSESTVTALFEDHRGWLWLGTENKGLELFHKPSGRFYLFNPTLNPSYPASTFEIDEILESPDGRIWVMQRTKGVYSIEIPAQWEKMLPDTNDLTNLARIKQYPLPPPLVINGASENTSGMEIEPDGSILFATRFRLMRLNPDKPVIEDLSHLVAGEPLNKITLGQGPSAGDLYCVTNLSIKRIRNGEVRTWPLPDPVNEKFCNTYTDNDGNVWVGIGTLIWRIAPGKDINFAQPDWEMDESPTSITTDRNGNIWLGTYGYGLRKFNLRKKGFHTTAQGQSIWNIWQDTRGQYYCKLVNKLHRIDAATGAILPYHGFKGATSRILDMLVQPDGHIWLLGREDQEDGNGYLQEYDAQQQLIRRFVFPFNMYTYARMLRQQDGTFWMTGANCQMVMLHPDIGRPQYFNYNNIFSANANTARAYAFIEDETGKLWIGTQMGLIQMTMENGQPRFQLIRSEPRQKKGLNSNSIACLYKDIQQNILWVGTKGGGINRMDLQSGDIQYITTDNGLPNNVVYGILPGASGEIWCSTNRGLAKIRFKPADPEHPDITTFTTANGLQDNEFNTQAYRKTPQGELLFGGIKGFNRFFPEEIQLDTTPPPVYLIGLEINQKPVVFGREGSPLTAPLEYLTRIDLGCEQNNLSFEFSALDFTDPLHNRYRYKMEGLDPEWVETGNDHFAHFTHLEPGRYTLHVQGSNGEGRWQETAQPLLIVIHPPWWRSDLAYGVYMLVLCYLGWQGYQFQIRRVKLQEQLAYEHRETERIRALEQMKTDFFSNVTHEFRTPLTLMLEPLRQLLQNPRDPHLTEKLQLIERNSRRLLGLVNQLLDLAKVESGLMQLDLRPGQLEETLRQVYQPFLLLAEQKGIRLYLDIQGQWPLMIYDAHKVELVVNNLISNALKFTDTQGEVWVKAARSDQEITITVQDTGAGIAPGDLSHIFNRFYQVGQTNGGTGIGLALSRELAELMSGSIEAQSTPGTGSSFLFRLPVLLSDQHRYVTDTLAASALAPETTVAQPAWSREAQEETPLVLIVEDNVELRQFIRQSLEARWQVLEASNGAEGLQKAQEVLPDLVVSDLMMPGMDGYALTSALKSETLTAHIPVILLTARSTTDARIKGLQTGADDYLTKPFNAEELLARMDNLVTQRRLLRARYLKEQAGAAIEHQLPENLNDPDVQFMRRWIATLETHLSDSNMGVEEFAQKMFISRVQLHRKLKAISDKNAGDFIRDYRLERAMAMLKNREGLVSEIADRTGFGNEKYFSTIFKEKYGVSPSQVV